MSPDLELDPTDYHLRLMIEEMQRDGRSEHAIESAVRTASGSKPPPTLRDNQPNRDRQPRSAHLRREHQPAAALPAEPVALRLCRGQDSEALDRLAELEGLPTPNGRYVVAEVEGVVVAAVPLGPGPPLGDPFRPTAQLISLLELRAKQFAAHPTSGLIRSQA